MCYYIIFYFYVILIISHLRFMFVLKIINLYYVLYNVYIVKSYNIHILFFLGTFTYCIYLYEYVNVLFLLKTFFFFKQVFVKVVFGTIFKLLRVVRLFCLQPLKTGTLSRFSFRLNIDFGRITYYVKHTMVANLPAAFRPITLLN